MRSLRMPSLDSGSAPDSAPHEGGELHDHALRGGAAMSNMSDEQALTEAQRRWGSDAKISHFGPYFEVGDERWTRGTATHSWDAAFADADWWARFPSAWESREEKAARFIRESGKTVHASDCSTSLAPAEEPGPCDCDTIQPLVEDYDHECGPTCAADGCVCPCHDEHAEGRS